jgi:hypothetical protein
MRRAGCDYGMELDINRGHVGFEFYNVLGPGEAGPEGAEQFKERRYFSRSGAFPGVEGLRYFMREVVRDTGNAPVPRYTGREARDFFFLVARELLPTPDLSPMGGRTAEGRWTAATLPESAVAFPQALARTVLHPQKGPRIHLFELDLRWLETALCLPDDGASCAPEADSADERPAAILPLGVFSAGRSLWIDGERVGEDSSPRRPGQTRYLVLRSSRPGGPLLPATAPAPSGASPSLSIQSSPAVERTGRGRFTSASCVPDGQDQMLLYATGLGECDEALESVLRHAGCNDVVRLGQAKPLLLASGEHYAGAYGDLFPPVADGPSLLFTRSRRRYSTRIFAHVKPQPRRVWTQVQPERTRASALRQANKAAADLGLPPVKRLDDLCGPPYADVPRMRKLRWRDPVDGSICGQGRGHRTRGSRQPVKPSK